MEEAAIRFQQGDKLQKGKYVIDKFLAQGGTGSVYLALEPNLNRFVVIKILSPELMEDKINATSLIYEARAAVKLDHPHVIKVYTLEQEIINDVEHTYLVMEYGNEGDLREAFGSLISNDGDRYRLMYDIATGLAYVHENGFIHRDLKPDNIYVRDGVVKIGDLGTAKTIGEKTRELSTRGIMTPVYSSPEQLQFKTLDQRSDIYTLGIIFFEVMTGKRPYKFFDAHLNDDPVPRITDVDDSLPEEMADIIARMMAKPPEKRYQTVNELIIDLEKVMDKYDVTPSITNSTENSTKPLPSITKTEFQEKKYHFVIAILVTAIILLLSVILYLNM